MNNIKYFDEYFGRELEMEVLANELNENREGGIRGFINRRKSRKIKRELTEEIEMSKNIIDGIKTGLDSLSDDFGEIKKSLDSGEGSKNEKGEKQKMLDNITKLLEKSRETSWDINELIDEGEIDYAGFTANVGIASVRYFGVFLYPYTSSVLIHKGYNYFFSLVKNTIRKALVMLQLNFDQFENLIITKSLMSDEMLRANDEDETITTFYTEIYKDLFDKEHGSLKGKKGWDIAEKKLKAAKMKSDELRKAAKAEQQRNNAYNNLDQYNNTYTKSLETLRQYSQDDVQKELDGIKTSMTKLAGQDVDLTVFAELIIAAAEEHAYKVSSSIYNKFAKMTEVFSLPNQAKLLELIQAANKEKMNRLAKDIEDKKKEVADKAEKEGIDELETEGKKIFEEKLNGKLELDGEDYHYKVIEIGDCGNDDAYEIFKKGSGKLTDKERETLTKWFMGHPEVLDECDETLKAMFPNLEDYETVNDYIDALTRIINDGLDMSVVEGDAEEDEESDDEEEKKEKSDDESISENYILSFDDYFIFEGKKNSNKEYLSGKSETESDKKDGYFFDITKLSDNEKDEFKKLFGTDKKQRVAKLAIKTIGKDIINDREFTSRVDDLVDVACKSFKKDKKESINKNLYDCTKKAIDKLKDEESKDYPILSKRNEDENKSEDTKKSEA